MNMLELNAFIQNGKDLINKEILQFDINEQGKIIRMIIDARKKEALKMPFYKTFSGSKVTGEFRD